LIGDPLSVAVLVRFLDRTVVDGRHFFSGEGCFFRIGVEGMGGMRFVGFAGED